MVMRSEKMIEWKRVINELEQGKEFAYRLMTNLNHPFSDEINQSLISEILSSYKKAIVLLNSGGSPAGKTNQRERFSDKDFQNVVKKRKISEESEKVKLCVGKGQDGGCISDGYCWRKYGQKEILKSKNPRGYYRCTHRFSQGCLAVKQVQRSDTDPSVFEVKYIGTHTCDITPAAAVNHVSVRKTDNNTYDSDTKSEVLMLNLDELENKKAIFRTFSFSKVEPENMEWKNGIFLENLMENLSPEETTTGSVINTAELMSEQTSATNSPTGDSYLSSLDNIIDFEADFSFDTYLELLN